MRNFDSAGACGGGVRVGGSHRLATAITRRYAAVGLRCDYGLLDSLDAIATSAIANLSSNPLRDHYVAVLEITPDFVVIGELLSGPSG